AREEVTAAEQAAATNESEAATLRSEVERLEGLLAAEKASHEEEMRRGARLGDQLQTAYQEKAALEEEIETLKGSATAEGKGIEEGCYSVAAKAGTPKDQGVVPPALPKTMSPFQRIKVDNVRFADERLHDNSYWAKDDTDTGYDAKAHEILGQVRRSGFRHKKTKKKRGTYRGEQIDHQTHSIKFENSDDEANALSFPKRQKQRFSSRPISIALVGPWEGEAMDGAFKATWFQEQLSRVIQVIEMDGCAYQEMITHLHLCSIMCPKKDGTEKVLGANGPDLDWCDSVQEDEYLYNYGAKALDEVTIMH
ncbi:hypothetical protein ACJX0J_019714, partial [Zea mays]